MKASILTSTLSAVTLAAALAAPALAAPGDRVHPGGASGVYIRYEGGANHGWRVETTDPRGSGAQTYTGTLATDGHFTDVHLVRPEGEDSFSGEGSGSLSFTFKTAAGIDGLAFRDKDGSQITFNLSMDGTLLSTSQINLGDRDHHPDSNPFTLKAPYFDGRPDGFHAGDASGVYLWHRMGVDHGWHLETTDPLKTGAHTYSGTITTDGKFVDMQVVRPEADDSATIDGSGALNFSFKTYAGIDGIDWRVAGGTQMTFTLYEDGALMAASAINIGDESTHPAGDPFTISMP